METVVLNTGELLNVHDRDGCFGPPCVIHAPSDHHMRQWPHHWRDDRAIMERICKHGIGHPDPDDYKVRNSRYQGIHGCDGCCSISRSG